MAKYDDKLKAGRSERTPFIRGESPGHRHDRRLRNAMQDRQAFKQFCDRHNFEFLVKNQGEHWIVRDMMRLAEWWPRSAKLVFNKDWANGIHVHDVIQLRAQIQKKWLVEKKEDGDGQDEVEGAN